MNAKVLLILLLVIALVAGIGAAIFLLTRQPQSTPGPAITTPTATAAPVTTSEGKAELSVDSDAASFAVGQTGTVDIFLDTKGEAIEGFQFIANMSGSALPAIVDTDTATQGIQIAPAPIPNMTVATNTVTNEGDRSVIRFAMLLDDTASGGFTTSTPTKIATISVTPGSGGTISVNFSEQNSRVRLESSGADSIAKSTASTFTVGSTGALAQASSSPQSAAVSSQTTPAPNTVGQFCLQSCVSDNDCAAGLVCQVDRCVNPACSTSQTCSCGQTTQAPVATATPRASAVASASAKPTGTPIATLIAQATIIPTADPIATDSANLPTAGSFETTLLVMGAGLLLFGTGIVLASNRATIQS